MCCVRKLWVTEKTYIGNYIGFNKMDISENEFMKSAYLLRGYIAIGTLVEAVFTNELGATSIVVLLMYSDSNKLNTNRRREDKYIEKNN